MNTNMRGPQNNGAFSLFFIHLAGVREAASGRAVSLHLILFLSADTEAWQGPQILIQPGTKFPSWAPCVSHLLLCCCTHMPLAKINERAPFSCYCHLQERFYKELAVVLLRALRHDCGEMAVKGSVGRFLEVPLTYFHGSRARTLEGTYIISHI